jgi:hypothetical protein
MQLGDIAAAGDCLATLLDPGSAHDDDGEGQTAVKGTEPNHGIDHRMMGRFPEGATDRGGAQR